MNAEPFVPKKKTLPALREAVQGCRGCDLYRNATQAVFGEGARRAEVLFVGEQPGDKEDMAGKPFVGPAGQLLDRALEEAGIERKQTYVTNAVKHFKWQARGKRRIHQKPSWSEAVACRPWLEAELEVVRPRVVVCLGATAAQSLLGRDFRVTQHRGELLESDLAEHVTATVHPSSILRQQDEESRHAELAAFVDDLRVVARLLEATAARR
jgi:uracil-DNA glycosylase family protein